MKSDLGFLLCQSDACAVTLNSDSAHRFVRLSDSNRKATMEIEKQSYPDHPERFEHCKQVLGSKGLNGRCYWEVERKGEVFIGAAYNKLKRKGKGYDTLLGMNKDSWSVFCSDKSTFSGWKDDRREVVFSPFYSNTIAVYVDSPAGTLSFYRVSSDEFIHLHTFNTTFTEPLYPAFGFSVWSAGSSVTLPWVKEEWSTPRTTFRNSFESVLTQFLYQTYTKISSLLAQ